MQPFTAIDQLPTELITRLEQLGYLTMTPIQASAIPLLFEQKDIIAQAKTGSGKTAAFGIPLLCAIKTQHRNPQALILCPTRELADQVSKELRQLAQFKENLKILTLCGGTPMRPQIASLENGAHILVGTPGRIQDHLSRGTIQLHKIHTLILDEADRMLDMGFYDEISKIVSNLPKKRQSMLFSATYPNNIQKLAKEILSDPSLVKIDTTHTDTAIEQFGLEVSAHNKDEMLLRLLGHYNPAKAIIFCTTKIEAFSLAELLQKNHIDALDLQGDLDQRQRHERLLRFANNSLRVLTATDIASRGLDVKDIDMVINYSLPQEREVYTHRIGRTARAGAEGMAISLYLPHEQEKLMTFSPSLKLIQARNLEIKKKFSLLAPNATICIDGGKKQKLRPGDILGALSKEIGIAPEHIGKIDLFDLHSYIALDKKSLKRAHLGLQQGKIKGKRFRVWILE